MSTTMTVSPAVAEALHDLRWSIDTQLTEIVDAATREQRKSDRLGGPEADLRLTEDELVEEVRNRLADEEDSVLIIGDSLYTLLGAVVRDVAREREDVLRAVRFSEEV